jgi:hypothetical protein
LAVVGQEFTASTPHTGEAGFMNLDGLDFPVYGGGQEMRCRSVIDDGVVVARETECDLGMVEDTFDVVGSQSGLSQVMLIKVGPRHELEGISS